LEVIEGLVKLAVGLRERLVAGLRERPVVG
jgi:hypothetical protein